MTTCYDENMNTYATTYKLRRKAFTVNSQNIKQAYGIQLSFVLEINLQKEEFIEKCHASIFEPFLEWDCVQAWHYLRTEKKGIYSK